jgi:hypothetical protein
MSKDFYLEIYELIIYQSSHFMFQPYTLLLLIN